VKNHVTQQSKRIHRSFGRRGKKIQETCEDIIVGEFCPKSQNQFTRRKH